MMMMICRQYLLMNLLPGLGLEKMELERLQIVDAIKGYKSKAVRYNSL